MPIELGEVKRRFQLDCMRRMSDGGDVEGEQVGKVGLRRSVGVVVRHCEGLAGAWKGTRDHKTGK